MNIVTAMAFFIVLAVIYGGLMTQIFNTELFQYSGFTLLQRSYTQPGQGVNGSTIADLQTNDTAKRETPEMTETQMNVSGRVVPDDDCLFNPSLPKCAPIEGKCPSGFLMNENEQCFPDKPCPTGFTKLDEDETGTCYPVSHLPTPFLTARDNISSRSVS
jgi:hypothetical protein